MEECLDHIQLIWDNCKEYNQEGFYYNLADKLDRSFKKMIKNYLPNIQIIVPASNHYSHSRKHAGHQPEHAAAIKSITEQSSSFE